jgi:MFS family permease
VTSPTPVVAAESRGGSLAVLRHCGFAAFFVAATISNGGSWMQTVAVPALLFDLTKQATWLGYSSMAILIPAVILTPYAGVLSDRISRRKILIVTQLVQMSTALAMWALFRADALTPWRILGLGFVGGIAAGFQSSAWQSFIPLLVPPKDMLQAIKLNSTQFTLARAIGPGFAGIVVATWGTGAAILINALTYPLVIGVLVFAHPRENSVVSREESVGVALRSGGRYVWDHYPIRLAVLIAFISAVCGQSMQHVSAAVSSRLFDRPSTDNAGLLTALGLGALAAAALHSGMGSRWRLSQLATLSLALYTTATALVAATSNYVIGMFGYFVSGVGHLTMAIVLNTVIQGRVPDAMRGRAVSFYIFGILLGIPIGSFALGLIGDAFSMRAALWSDVVVMSTVGGVLVACGALKAFDRDSDDEPAAIAAP